jgi:hypothetical protein
MLKVTSGLETLSTTEKESWGVAYPSGQALLIKTQIVEI